MTPGDASLVDVVSARRNRVLAIAVALLQEGGLDAVTPEAVARQSDASPESVRFLFGSHDNLLGQAIEEIRVWRHERIGEMLATFPPVGSSLADWTAAVDRVSRGLVWLYGGEPHTFWQLCCDAARRPALAAVAAECLAATQDQLVQLLLDCGVERADLLATPIFGMVHGVITYHRISAGTGGSVPAEPTEDLLDDLSHGLLSLITGHLELLGGQRTLRPAVS